MRQRNLALQALEWYVENGVDEVLSDVPLNRTKMPDLPKREEARPAAANTQTNTLEFLGAAEAKVEALKLAQGAKTLEELAEAIRTFDALAIKKTATNMVFSDGNPEAKVMLVGEAPGADEDRQGKPFVGASGQLLDVILSHIGLSRTEESPDKAVYISNILNWRPPGNRTPSPAEIDVSQAFIERHIELVQPKILILCGGVSAKALLGSSEGITKLRGQFQTFKPLVLQSDLNIPCIATYHPAYLLRTPAQKGKVWADMLLLKEKLQELGINAG